MIGENSQEELTHSIWHVSVIFDSWYTYRFNNIEFLLWHCTQYTSWIQMWLNSYLNLQSIEYLNMVGGTIHFWQKSYEDLHVTPVKKYISLLESALELKHLTAKDTYMAHLEFLPCILLSILELLCLWLR